LLCESEEQRQQLRDLFDPGRVEFVGRQRRAEYLRSYDRIDLCLDPLVYNGITTTCDALWMGVPVITLPGETAPSRAGLSILTNLGAPELIASSKDEFVAIAADLAGDHGRRKEFRSTLRTRISNSPLMDASKFARTVESAYRNSLGI
jgi:predicted O-linked N-acetylglucosamine transferase (SPINDLY family)